MSNVVIDTNVLITANGDCKQAAPKCVESCEKSLLRIYNEGIVVWIDDRYLILNEYKKHLNFSGQPGIGNFFFKRLHDFQGDENVVKQVSITPIGNSECPESFSEFPDNPELEGFDHSDRKFVAVAIASRVYPDIYNATDSDWYNFQEALERDGLKIIQLCPHLFETC